MSQRVAIRQKIRWASAVRAWEAFTRWDRLWAREWAEGPWVGGVGRGAIPVAKRVRKGSWEGPVGRGGAEVCKFRSNKLEYASKKRVS